jgi:hypothetical protein
MIGYRVEKLLIFMRFRGPEALNDIPVDPKVGDDCGGRSIGKRL